MAASPGLIPAKSSRLALALSEAIILASETFSGIFHLELNWPALRPAHLEAPTEVVGEGQLEHGLGSPPVLLRRLLDVRQVANSALMARARCLLRKLRVAVDLVVVDRLGYAGAAAGDADEATDRQRVEERLLDLALDRPRPPH